MALHNCENSKCTSKASGRNLFCVKCWSHIPLGHQDGIRDDAKKGEQTLRAKPSREWMTRTLKYINEPPRQSPKPISFSHV